MYALYTQLQTMLGGVVRLLTTHPAKSAWLHPVSHPCNVVSMLALKKYANRSEYDDHDSRLGEKTPIFPNVAAMVNLLVVFTSSPM